MTERLYYRDAYAHDFDAHIVERAADGRRVYLDRTAFYPTSGGQPNDLGTLGGVPVTDVIDEDERVAHVLEQPLQGDTVHGCVDWTRRYDFMQQHTGQHLLSALLTDEYRAPTVSVHFGDVTSTLDIDGSLDARDLARAEQRANALVAEHREVQVTFEDAALATGLRKPSDRGGTLRIVSIEGLDRSACGGTHVRNSAEIGAVLLRRVEKVRGAQRVEFVCGQRAIARARADFLALAAMGQALTASAEELPTLVPVLAQERKAASQALQRLQDELARYQARERYERVPPGPSGRRVLLQLSDTGALEDWRALGIAWSTLPQAVALFAVRATRTVLLTASEDAGVDAGKVLRAALVAVGGKGGGSARLAQGSAPEAAAFAQAIDVITGAVQ